jgi:TetR/AcrR family transcriptional repressor of nem operon
VRQQKVREHPSPARRSAVAEKILDVAESLAQTRGFNGFSYADVAAKLLVTKASIHYHFPSKADLGRALIERYHAAFAHALQGIDLETGDAREKLQRYVALYEAVLRHKRMCLCGMLAAEYATLPAMMQDELRRFFDANERWLTHVLEDGRNANHLTFSEPPHERARTLLGAFEGAMLVARTYGDPRRFLTSAEAVLGDLLGGKKRS